MATVLNHPLMRSLERSLLITISMVMLGCGADRNTRTSFPSMKEWRQVQMGMSEQEVVRLLGKPDTRDVRRFPKDNGIATIRLLYGSPINSRKNHMLYVVLMGGDGRVIETRTELQD